MNFRLPLTDTKEDGMTTAVTTRTLAEIADRTSGADLHSEYQAATDALDSTNEIASLHTFATLCAVAIARVRILEMQR